MIPIVLILLFIVMPVGANELNGSFENETYVSPSATFSCNWHKKQLSVDLDSLTDNYNEEKTELVKFSSFSSGDYINYWYSLSPKSAISAIENGISSNENKNLELLFTQLEQDVFRDVLLFNLREVRHETLAVTNGSAALKVYLAEFDEKIQHIAGITWISDKHVITSIVLPLDMSLPASKTVLEPIQISNLARAHFYSCKLSTN